MSFLETTLESLRMAKSKAIIQKNDDKDTWNVYALKQDNSILNVESFQSKDHLKEKLSI